MLDRSLKPLLMLVAIAATSFFGSAATVHAADSAVWIDDTSFKFTSGSSSATFEQVGQMESGGTDFIVFAKDGELPSEDEECMGTPIYGFNAKDTYIYSAGALNNTVGESGALDSCGYVFDTKVIEITGDVKDTPKVGGLNDEYINGEIYRQCPDLKTDSNTKKLKGFGKKRSEAIITITTNLKPDASPLLEGGYDVCATLAGFLKNPKWLDGDLTKHLVENEGEEELVETTSCAVDGIGWVVCPVLTFIGRMNDAAFTFLQNILGIQPAVVGSEATRNAWSAFRDIANVAFVIAFMVIVYSQITSAGISNYGIKKLLPRIVVAAILVNVSFYICAIAVDISNIVGASIFTLLKDSIDVGSEIETTQWESSVGNILGIAATGIGVVLLVVALTMAPAVLLAFVLIILILIARQALIILLIVVSPLAFVAYLLPNTEDWFKKWWKAFVATLMVYPIVGLVFGASTLASSILVQVGQGGDPEDDQQLLMLIALGVAAVPLFAIPAILKGSLSAAGSIGTKISGLADRSTRMAGNQFGNRSKQYAGGAANAVRRRAMSGQGAFGRKGWRSAYGLGVGGMMRGTAKRNDKYKNLDDEAKSATETFLNTNAAAAARRKQAMVGQQAATVTGNALKSQATKTFLDSDETLEIRAKAKVDELELDVSQKAQDALFTEMTTRQGAQQLTRAGMQTQMATDLAHAAETAHEASSVQAERANSAARQAKSEFTERIGDESNGLAKVASGVQGASGAMRVVAAAKAAQSKETMETIQNIQSTLPYEIASDNAALEQRFASASTTEERVAYAKLMRGNGSPGVEALKRSLAAHTTANASLAPGAARDEAMKHELDLKEILAYDNDFRAAGRDLEVWANNEKPGQTFKQVSDSADVWSDQSAQRFASMSKPAQMKLIAKLANDRPDELRAFIARFKADDTARGKVKGAPQEMLEAFENGQDISTYVAKVDVGM